MKKTIPTSIARTLFYIEEDAYQKLDRYLSEVRTYFAHYEDSKDIIEDIESRIQEQLSELSAKDKTDRIITESHVDTLIKTMGRPQEFEGGSTETPDQPTLESHKKLYRDRENAIIGGVASGLASYFGVDPIIIRALFFLSVFFGGFGVIAYIFMWFAVPEAKTATQKLEMEGNPVTLEKVKKMVEEKIEEVKSDGGLKKKTEKVRGFIANLAHIFFKTFGKLIGTLLKIIALCGTVAVVTLLIIVITSHPLFLFGITGPLAPWVYLIISIVFLLVIIPILFLALAGSRLTDPQKKSYKTLAGILGLIWILACIAGTVIAFHVVKNRELYKETISDHYILIENNSWENN